MKKVNYYLILGLFIGVGIFVSLNKASATTLLPRACSVSINSPSNYQVVNPNQNLTISYTISCSSDRRVRANIYFTSTGDHYTQYNPSDHCNWTYQSGSRSYSVTYPSAGLLNAKQTEGSTAHFYVDVNEYARDDGNPPCYPENNAYHSFHDMRWVRFGEPPTHYACNTTTWQCYQSSTGPYTSLSACQAACVQPAACKINSFTANPTSVNYNGSTSLSWSTSNCNSCTASASPSNSYWSGTQSTSGNKTIYNLTKTTNFTLSCTGNTGSDTKSVTVNVNALPGLNVSCSVFPNPNQVGQSVTFTANVSGGITPYSYSWSGAVSGNTSSVSKSFNSAGTYTAYLTVTDNASQTKSTSCSVTINETPRQISLSANPTTVNYDGSTVLTWSANGYDSCQGYAEPRNSQWDTSVNFSGNKTINNLTQTTTFYLRCYYNFISNYDIRSVTVNVLPQPVTRYACNTSTWQCYQSASGPYTSLSACQADCQYTPPPVTRYACNTSTWQCYQSSSGPYTSLSACQADCQYTPPPVTRYACNTSTWQCYQSASGPYTSLSTCQTDCQQPLNCQITSFTANPNPVSAGDNTILNWNSSNCSYCNASANPSNSYWIGNKATNGSNIVYNLTQVTTFNLTCYGQNNTDTKTLTVNLSQNPSLNVSCWASPNPVQINQSVTFNSSVSNGSGNYYYSWSGAASGNSSSYSRSFSSNGTYWAYLTVTDSGGRTGSASCSVYVEGQTYNYPTLDFWADKYSLIKGEETYLRWTSTNTNYCTASNGWSGNRQTNGYELVKPSSQTTYNLTCYGANGSVSKSLTIYVSEGQNIGLTKLGRNLSNGDRSYEKTIRLADGEVAEFYLAVSAVDSDLVNVVIKDILPLSLTYMNGTTKINGVIQPDTITTTGLSLGNIARGTSKVITFQALSSAPGYYLTQTNTAEVTANGQNKITDSATIVFGVVLGAATVKTGPADSLLVMLLISFGLASVLFYYFTYNQKGKLVYAGIENKIREYQFNQAKKRIIKNSKK